MAEQRTGLPASDAKTWQVLQWASLQQTQPLVVQQALLMSSQTEPQVRLPPFDDMPSSRGLVQLPPFDDMPASAPSRGPAPRPLVWPEVAKMSISDFNQLIAAGGVASEDVQCMRYERNLYQNRVRRRQKCRQQSEKHKEARQAVAGARLSRASSTASQALPPAATVPAPPPAAMIPAATSSAPPPIAASSTLPPTTPVMLAAVPALQPTSAISSASLRASTWDGLQMLKAQISSLRARLDAIATAAEQLERKISWSENDGRSG